MILGELGERNCDSGTAAYTEHVLSLIDGEASKGRLRRTRVDVERRGGWSCPTGPDGEGGPLMIRNYGGTPTVMGAVMRTWMLSKGRRDQVRAYRAKPGRAAASRSGPPTRRLRVEPGAADLLAVGPADQPFIASDLGARGPLRRVVEAARGE